MSGNVIMRKGQGDRIELKAAAAITPGMLCERTSANAVQKNSAAADVQPQKLFALENALNGGLITTDYAADDQVQLNAVKPGDVVQGLIKIGVSLSIGDAVESAGAGDLQAFTTAGAIIGFALEAVTGGAALVRCDIEIA